MDNEALHAIEEHDIGKLKELLGKGINVNGKDAKGKTLLHHAASYQQESAVKCLLKNGADVLVSDRNGTALHLAVIRNNVEMTKIILKNVARKNLKKLIDAKSNDDGTAVLHLVAKSNCYVSIHTILQYGANYEIKNNAGRRAVDTTMRDDYEKLLRLIDECFTKAKNGDEQLIADLAQCKSTDDFVSALNCKNNDGHTIMQVLVLEGHFKLVADLQYKRWCRPKEDFIVTATSDRKGEIEKLMETTLECRKFWFNKLEIILALSSPVSNDSNPSIYIPADKWVSCSKTICRALEKAHKVLLEYRKIEGQERKLTANVAMKTLEEILEALGFDPEELFVIPDEEASYYRMLPSEHKHDVFWLIGIMNNAVESLYYLLRSIYTLQIFDAVKADDLDKAKDLLKTGGSAEWYDHRERSAFSYAIEKGNKKMIKLLLKSGTKLATERGILPLCLAIEKGDVKIVKLILKSVKNEDMLEFVDHRKKCESTALHAAAVAGRLDIVKILLRHGATYWIFDKKDNRPLDVSTSEEVSNFLNLVDEYFHDAKEADVELVFKLKALDTEDFMAIAGARNFHGETLADVADKANAKNLAGIILRMIREAKQDEK